MFFLWLFNLLVGTQRAGNDNDDDVQWFVPPQKHIEVIDVDDI